MIFLLISLLWAATILLAFLAGLELGRWNRRLMAALGVLRGDVRRTKDEQTPPPPKRDTSPGVVVTRRIPEPINLEEETGPVMPMTPMQVAAEEDAARKRGE